MYKNQKGERCHMYHSINIIKNNTTVNTWDTWHLIPVKCPVIAAPTMEENYVRIPGMSGSLDLSDYLTGEPEYSDRKGSLEFFVMNGYGVRENRRSEIASFLDGRKMRVILEDDPGYYYEGRVIMKDWKTEASENYSRVTFQYQFRPYKKSLADNSEVL